MKLKLPLYLQKGLGENSGIVKDADGNEVQGQLDEVKEIFIRAVNESAEKNALIKSLEKQVERLESALLEEI